MAEAQNRRDQFAGFPRKNETAKSMLADIVARHAPWGFHARSARLTIAN
jgi:hypothetical protein